MSLLQKTTPNQDVAAVSVFLILLCGIASYAWLLPNRQSNLTAFKQAQANEIGLKADKDNLDKAQASLAQAEASMQTAGIDLNKAALAMPATEDVPGLYVEMESVNAEAGNAGLTSVSYTLGTPTLDASTKTAKVPVTFLATGSYPKLKAFIATLEGSLRPMVIEQVSLASAPNGQYAVTLGGSFWASGLSAAYTSTPTK